MPAFVGGRIAAVLLGVYAFVPILPWVFGSLGMAWLGAPLDALLMAFLLWAVYAALRGQGALPLRQWGRPTPTTLLGIVMLALAWWDPIGLLPNLSNRLAGTGLLEVPLLRLLRGAATLAALVVTLHSLRPTEAKAAKRRENRAARRMRQLQGEKDPRA